MSASFPPGQAATTPVFCTFIGPDALILHMTSERTNQSTESWSSWRGKVTTLTFYWMLSPLLNGLRFGLGNTLKIGKIGWW